MDIKSSATHEVIALNAEQSACCSPATAPASTTACCEPENIATVINAAGQTVSACCGKPVNNESKSTACCG